MSLISRWYALWLAVALGSTAVHADVLSAVQTLRAGGCGGVMPAAVALYHQPSLDGLARRWADGATLAEAARAAGATATAIAAVRVNAPDAELLEVLRRQQCQTLLRQDLRAVGVYRRDTSSWLILTSGEATATHRSSAARPVAAPPPPAAGIARGAPLADASAAARVLQLVNAARARGAACGGRTYGPARPLNLSPTLAAAAAEHAVDMAQHNYFEHRTPQGQTPADRVRSRGYRDKLVGENIAFGPESAEEVVQGWLTSPGHCQNIMEPRFADMGVAFAAGRARHGLYWVQVLAEPSRE